MSRKPQKATNGPERAARSFSREPPTNLPRGGSRQPPTESGRPPAESLSRSGPSRPFVCREHHARTDGSSQAAGRSPKPAGRCPTRGAPPAWPNSGGAAEGTNRRPSRGTVLHPGASRGGQLGPDSARSPISGSASRRPYATPAPPDRPRRGDGQGELAGRLGVGGASSRPGSREGGERGKVGNPARV